MPAYPAGMDMPVHLLSADVLAHPAGYEGRFAPHLANTSQGFVWLVAALRALGLPLVLAAKAALTLLLVGYVVAFDAVGRARGDVRPIGALFGVATFASFYLTMGFANFALAVPAAFAALASAMRATRHDGLLRWGPTGAWLLATAGFHIIVAACALVQVGATALLAPGGSPVARRMRHAVVAGLPAAAYGGWVAWRARTGANWGDVAASLGAHRLPADEQIAHWLSGPWGGFTALGGAVAAATLLASLGRADRWGRYAAATLAFWSVAFVALPWHAQGWAYAQPRVLVFAWGVPAALAVWGPRPQRRLAVVGGLLGLYLIAWGDGATQASRQVATVVDGFDATQGEPATALTATPGFVASEPAAHPLLHASAYAATTGAWLTDRYHFNPTIHSAQPTPVPEAYGPPIPQFAFNALVACETDDACARAVSELADVAAQRARTWPTIVVVGAPPALLSALAARGLAPVDPARASVGAGATLRLRPARLELELTLPPGFEGPLEIRAGYPETIGWIDGAARPPFRADGPVTLGLDRFPAGPTTIEVRSAESVLAREVVEIQPGAAQPVRIDARAPLANDGAEQ